MLNADMALVFILGALLPIIGDQPRQVEAFLDRVEAGMQMPEGARPLSAYWRSYFPAAGGKKVQAIYSTTHAAGRQWVISNPGPFIVDGGCAIITVVIDVSSERVEAAECNGVG